MAVVVEDRLAPVGPVPPGHEARARLALRPVQDRLYRRPDQGGAVLGEQRQKPALADPRRADHRREVALEVPRMADVRLQHLEHVVAKGARGVEPERRDPDPLLEDLRRPAL